MTISAKSRHGGCVTSAQPAIPVANLIDHEHEVGIAKSCADKHYTACVWTLLCCGEVAVVPLEIDFHLPASTFTEYDLVVLAGLFIVVASFLLGQFG